MVATITSTRGRLKSRRSTSSDSAPTAGGQADGQHQGEPVVELEVVGAA